MTRKIFITLAVFLSVVFAQAESLRVNIDEFSKNLSMYKIVDVRDKALFLQGHIKGALNFPIALTYENKSLNGKLVEPTKMQTILRDLGLDINDNVVVYDNGSNEEGLIHFSSSLVSLLHSILFAISSSI